HPVMVDAQVDGVFLSQRQDVEKTGIAGEIQRGRRRRGVGERKELCLYLVEARKHAALDYQKLVGIDQDGQKGRQALKERAEDDAHQQQDVDVALELGEKEPVHDQGKEDHHADRDEEVEAGTEDDRVHRAQEKDDRGLDQDVKRVDADDAG